MSEGKQEVKQNLDRVVSVYLKIRDKKAELAAKFKADEAQINEKLQKISNVLLQHCKDENVESVRTHSGTFYRTTQSRFTTTDWPSMHKFVLEHQCVDLLEKRIQQTNMKQFLDDNPELLPPGLNNDVSYTVNVRRSK